MSPSASMSRRRTALEAPSRSCVPIANARSLRSAGISAAAAAPPPPPPPLRSATTEWTSWPSAAASCFARPPAVPPPTTPTLAPRPSRARFSWPHSAPPVASPPAACSVGTPGGSGTAQRAGRRMRCAAAPVVAKSSLLRSAPLSTSSKSIPVPRSTPTRSPGATALTDLPARTTTPTASRLGTKGSMQVPHAPRSCCTSPAVSAHACISTSTASAASGSASSYE
mmetsp:Transcript_26650/g.87463  ORF Transcript_26650/g.87463 Transcript_26650/m.87463 type:complete len:225 (-) Transcript_26650:168-842(-)